jgi:hypothetical protein
MQALSQLSYSPEFSDAEGYGVVGFQSSIDLTNFKTAIEAKAKKNDGAFRPRRFEQHSGKPECLVRL